MLLLTAGFPRCSWCGLLKLLFSLPGIELDFQMTSHRCLAIFFIFPHEASAWQRWCWAQEQWAGQVQYQILDPGLDSDSRFMCDPGESLPFSELLHFFQPA